MKPSRFDELKQNNISLSAQIDTAVTIGDHDTAVKLKRQLYSNKLEMLDLLESEERRAGITAKALRAKVETMPKLPRYATGVEALDAYGAFDGGIEVGSLVLFGGASGTGKSHLTLEIVCNVAEYSQSVFFNLEMGERRLDARLQKQLTKPQQWDNLIVDSYTRDLDDIVMEIKLYARDGARFFVIDSRMKINVKGEMQEYQKISHVTKTLSALCQQLDIIVFLINQISEEDLKTKRLSFKGSGDQLYDADIALFYVKEDENPFVRKLVCSKNRQDDRLFTLDLMLHNNKTVGNRSANISEYNADKIEMSVL